MLLKCAARAAMYHDMYNVLVLYTIHKKNTVLHQKNNPTKTLQSLNRDFMRAFLKLWMIVTIIRHTHIVAKLNIRFDMTARKKARSKKKWKTFMREKKTLKELFEWLQMNYYVEKKIVLSSLYSLLLHTTTTKLLRLKMKKKNRNFMNADWLCSERSFYYAPIWWCKSLYQKY